MTSEKHKAEYTFANKLPRPSKISDEKVYNYIKKLEVDGLPRVRAYAEAIDPAIYDLAPGQIEERLESFKRHSKNYNSIKEMVLAEQKEWSLRRSAVMQDKAMNLLNNLLDKANEIATNPDADAKQLAQAVSTLKTIMPAFTAIGAKNNMETSTTDKKSRAGRYIN